MLLVINFGIRQQPSRNNSTLYCIEYLLNKKKCFWVIIVFLILLRSPAYSYSCPFSTEPLLRSLKLLATICRLIEEAHLNTWMDTLSHTVERAPKSPISCHKFIWLRFLMENGLSRRSQKNSTDSGKLGQSLESHFYFFWKIMWREKSGSNMACWLGCLFDVSMFERFSVSESTAAQS